MTSIRTPHAAVVIWNYDEKFGSGTANSIDKVESTIVSTLSLISISTSKSKSNPQGSFQMMLAPSKNWVSTITPGSWCVILMSNKPITEDDVKRKANPEKVKMIGKIETVRVDVSVGDDGARNTRYMVTGVDWGYVFNNIIYIDNAIGAANEPRTQGQATTLALYKILFDDTGVQNNFSTTNNITSLLNAFGKNLTFTQQGVEINRLANAAYDFRMPQEMVTYFGFLNGAGKAGVSNKINDALTLITGKLSGEDRYDSEEPSFGYIDPFSLQGQHSFWQVLIENSNQAINEMYSELRWEKGGPRLALYNRIKPFSIKSGSDSPVKSLFKRIRCHSIDKEDVIGINAGTNWRDKYNFIEIKPITQEPGIVDAWYKPDAQNFDSTAFQREGFRPLIVSTKQFPRGAANAPAIDYKQLPVWSNAMKEWFFDTHRMLNGTLTLIGQSEYLAVGNNIMFDSELISPSHNLNKDSLNFKDDIFILGHIESVSHSFSVNNEGARQYVTTVQFVRGILVNNAKNLIGIGTLDLRASTLTENDRKNKANIFSSSSENDPDPNKVNGT